MKQLLTTRELEVTELTAYGLSQDEIADYLKISRFTVDEFIRRAKRKLNIQKATELAAWYYKTEFNISIASRVSDRLRQCISAALLSLMLFTLVIENMNMLRVQAVRTISARTVRTNHTSGRRSKENYCFS